MSITAINGDCLEKMKNLPDRSVDCFICDLPYEQLTKKTCQWDIKIDLNNFWEQVKRLCKDDHTPVLMFCNTKFGYELIKSNPDWFRYDLVWNKERGVSFLTSGKLPMKSHEMIYVFSKKGAYYKRIDIEGQFKSYKPSNIVSKVRTVPPASGYVKSDGNDGTTRVPLSVITIRKPNTLGHPTEKPQELYKWLLSRYCPDGGIVLDPTAGSFNSVIVAKQLGMKGIGIEKDKDFFYKAINKFSQL